MKTHDSSTGFNEDRNLALSFGALILVLMLIITGTGIYLYSYQQMKEENRLSGALAEVLSESIKGISSSREYQTQLLVKAITENTSALESVSIESFEGIIIAHSIPSLNGTHINNMEPSITPEDFKKHDKIVFEHKHNNTAVKEIIIPYRRETHAPPAGIIRIGLNVEQARWWIKINLIVLVSLIAALTFSAILIVLRLSRYFGSRVRNFAIQMRTIFDSIPALIYMKDFEGRYLFVNNRWAGIFNTTNDRVKGKTDLDFFPEEIARVFMANDRYALKNDMAVETEEQSFLADGMHSYQSIKVPIKDSSGKIYALCGISTDITERKKSEDALRKGEEKYRRLLDLAPDPFFHGDQEGNFINTNDAAIELTGYTREELLAMNIKDLFPEYILNQKPLRYDLVTLGHTLKTERVIKKKTGELLTVEMNSKKMPDGTFQSFFRDITRRNQAEEALKETEEIFRYFMENSPIYVFFKDENIRSIRLSKNYEQLLGKPLSEILGKTMYDIFPGDFARSMIEDDKHVLEKGEIISADEEFNGRYYTTIKFPIFLDGKPRYLAGYTIDITERKHAEKIIESEKERLLVTLRSIGDAVITTDINGQIILMNRVAEKLTGWTAKEAQTRDIMEVFNIVDEITRDPGDNPAKKVMKMKNIIELPEQTLLLSRDGTERLIADSAAPIRGSDNSITGIVLVFRDITDKRKTELLLLNSQKLESLGVLAGGIAHDFNNLLSGIFGYLELMKIQLKKENFSKLDESLNKAMQVFGRTKALTQQLLTFARGGEPHKKNIQISGMLISNTQFVLSGAKVSSSFDIKDNLWHCLADENQIAQVLDNIIINAVQSMPDGGIISIKADNYFNDSTDRSNLLLPGRYVRVSITDRGSGIARENVSRIFDPFYSTKAGGTGLGLATSYSIMKKHGGAITVESEPGKGSTFTLYIPAAPESINIHKESHNTEIPKFTGRILVMDDEDFVRNTASAILESMGISSDTAADGDDAVTKYIEAYNSGLPYTAVILDLTIKGGPGGKKTLEILKNFDPDIVAIASSGYSVDPVMANPEHFGFRDRLIKPYRIDELVTVLNRVMKD